jgi:ribosomal protein L20A (L18A)
MKEIYEFKVTDRVVAKLEDIFERDINKIQEDEVVEYLYSKMAEHDGIKCNNKANIYWVEGEECDSRN